MEKEEHRACTVCKRGFATFLFPEQRELQELQWGIAVMWQSGLTRRRRACQFPRYKCRRLRGCGCKTRTRKEDAPAHLPMGSDPISAPDRAAVLGHIQRSLSLERLRQSAHSAHLRRRGLDNFRIQIGIDC